MAHAVAGGGVPCSAVALFDRLDAEGYEQVVYAHDRRTGLRCFVAIHSTVLGPALGGTRFREFGSEEEALTDVLRLAKGMTYKAAAAGVALGGGKAVILGDPSSTRTEELIEAYGDVVDGLAGRYLTAEDVGTTQTDMDLIATRTPHVTGTSHGSGDPSPSTARGVLAAMTAAARHRWDDGDLAGRRVVVVGAGKVGSALIAGLVERGALVTVSDVRSGALRSAAEMGPSVEVIAPDRALSHPCDILAPCALGGILSARTVPTLRCEVVCGSANNQLATPGDAVRLGERRILYVPDFVASAGGICNIFEELTPGPYDPSSAATRIDRIADTTTEVLEMAERDDLSTTDAAEQLAEHRIDTAATAGAEAFPGALR